MAQQNKQKNDEKQNQSFDPKAFQEELAKQFEAEKKKFFEDAQKELDAAKKSLAEKEADLKEVQKEAEKSAKVIEKDLEAQEKAFKQKLAAEKKVPIHIPEDPLNPDDVVPVGLNGIIYAIPRGQTFEVPESIFNVWKYSYDQTVKAQRKIKVEKNKDIQILS